MGKKKLFLIFAPPLALGLFFRLLRLDVISYSYDQARDAFLSQEILTGNLKIVGPPTDLQVVFHGPLYYYVSAIFYLLSKDPRFVVICFAILNILSAIPLGYLVYKMFGSKLTAWVFLLLFALSPELIFYGRFLSNVSLVIPSLSLGFTALYFISKKRMAVLAGIGLGLAAQAEFFLLSLFPLTLIFLALNRQSKKNIAIFSTSYLLSISPYFLAELKFKFRGLLTFLEFSGSSHSGPVEILNRFVFGFSSLFARNYFSVPPLVIFIVILISLVFLFQKYKSPFSLLAFYLLAVVPLFIFTSPGPIFFMIGSLIPLLIIISSSVSSKPVFGLILVIIIVLNNLPRAVRGVEADATFTGSETGMILRDEMAALDSIYAYGGNLSYNSITSPLYMNTTWSYLFNWYGKQKYGFIPMWHGNNQIGVVGALANKPSTGNEDFDALIIENRVPVRWINEISVIETYRTKPQETKKFGQITVIFGKRIK